MPPNARFRVFNSNLKVLCERANQSSTKGCGGCNPLEGIVCFYNNTSILLYVLRWQVGPPSPPKSATALITHI